jgi:hypothetical protein
VFWVLSRTPLLRQGGPRAYVKPKGEEVELVFFGTSISCGYLHASIDQVALSDLPSSCSPTYRYEHITYQDHNHFS